MGSNSSGSGGARGGAGRAGESAVSQHVAGYADLVTPPGMTISPAGQIKMKAPKNASQAAAQLKTVTKAHEIATREARSVKIGNPARPAATLRALHTGKQLQRAINWAKKFAK